jgi:hypothetical protein
MVHVERAVRPVRAAEARKLRMRQELLAHLEAACEEEHARLGDREAAQAEAVRRFGDPAAVTAELQASVPLLERVLYTPVPVSALSRVLAPLVARRPAESAARFAIRVSLLWAAFGLLATSLSALPRLTSVTLDPAEATVSAHCLGAVGAAAFVFMLLICAMGREVSGRLVPAAALRAAGFGLGAAMVHVLSIPAGLRLILGEVPFAPERVVNWVVATGLMVLFVAVVLRLSASRRALREEWTTLEIGD